MSAPTNGRVHASFAPSPSQGRSPGQLIPALWKELRSPNASLGLMVVFARDFPWRPDDPSEQVLHWILMLVSSEPPRSVKFRLPSPGQVQPIHSFHGNSQRCPAGHTAIKRTGI